MIYLTIFSSVVLLIPICLGIGECLSNFVYQPIKSTVFGVLDCYVVFKVVEQTLKCVEWIAKGSISNLDVFEKVVCTQIFFLTLGIVACLFMGIKYLYKGD